MDDCSDGLSKLPGAIFQNQPHLSKQNPSFDRRSKIKRQDLVSKLQNQVFSRPGLQLLLLLILLGQFF
jgi:hypothetical protein